MKPTRPFTPDMSMPSLRTLLSAMPSTPDIYTNEELFILCDEGEADEAESEEAETDEGETDEGKTHEGEVSGDHPLWSSYRPVAADAPAPTRSGSSGFFAAALVAAAAVLSLYHLAGGERTMPAASDTSGGSLLMSDDEQEQPEPRRPASRLGAPFLVFASLVPILGLAGIVLAARAARRRTKSTASGPFWRPSAG